MSRCGRSLVVLLRLLLGVVLGTVAIVATPVLRAATNTLVVTNTNDSGSGSLRQAIADALPNDIITFDPSLSGGTITLASDEIDSHELYVSKALTIRGPGAGLLAISGHDFGRIFRIRGQSNQHVEISGLTLTEGHTDCFPPGLNCNGLYGGAILIESGSVTLSGLVLTNNKARGTGAAIQVWPYLLGDPLPGEPGQYAPTDVVLRDSVVTENVTDDIGTIAVFGGDVAITNSTIRNNFAKIGGGGLYHQWGGTVTLTNVTISGNRANGPGGGIVVNESGITALNVRSSTIVDNWADADNNDFGWGGGIGVATFGVLSHINVRDSIVAGNHGPSDKGPDCSGPINSQGHNLWGVTLDCPTNVPGDLTLAGLGVGIGAVLDPTLALNAPGTTPTHALVPGSPAIGAAEGGANCPATDQRGVTRPQGTGCDIGALEFDRFYTVELLGLGPGLPRAKTPGPYRSDEVVTIEPFPAYFPAPTGQAYFIQWRVDGQLVGWDYTLLLPINGQNHSVRAEFTLIPPFSLPLFPDVYSNRADAQAINALKVRGLVRGYANGNFGPDDTVQRAQMAALIARAMPNGPGTPTSGTLAPPACTVAGTWDCEDWGNEFKDQNGLVPSLWRNVGTLQHYEVAFGYDGAGCAARHVPSPCFAPTEEVSYAQTISFITRAMKAKGYWSDQPGQAISYAGVPGVHAEDFKTFHYYTQGLGGISAPPADWSGAATRGWFAMALWQALNSYFSENHLP